MLSQSDMHIKMIAPIIAPHLAHIDELLDRLTTMEASALQSIGIQENAKSSTLSPHPQVEVLSEKSPKTLQTKAPPSSMTPSVEASSISHQDGETLEDCYVATGLRRRSAGMTSSNAAEKSPTWKASTNQ